MGTRNLIAAMIDGEYKIAQYGQWDGYPSGVGVEVLDFLKNTDISKFKKQLKSTRFLTQKDFDRINQENGNQWTGKYPKLSRDTGSKILGMVLDGTTELRNEIGFAGDSLMCEYAYIIDFDLGLFEIYQGFNREEITEGRFLSSDDSLEKSDGYEPVKIVKSYSIDDLPSEETFLKEVDPEYEDNE